jgi:phytoene/squalene synthetase
MNHLALFDSTCAECSRLITQRYSTSFSSGIRAFHPKFRPPIYAIYGFVRFADEIVDTFHNYPKEQLLERFKNDTNQAIADGISLNPVLHSFQRVVRQYNIEQELSDQLNVLRKEEKYLEAQRLEQRTLYDLEMMK